MAITKTIRIMLEQVEPKGYRAGTDNQDDGVS